MTNAPFPHSNQGEIQRWDGFRWESLDKLTDEILAEAGLQRTYHQRTYHRKTVHAASPSGVRARTEDLPSSHIEDPTMKVKAPDSMLSALGNTFVNLTLAEAGLERIYTLLTEAHDIETTTTEPPTSVMGYVRACQLLSHEIDEWRQRIESFLGGFKLNEDGSLHSLINREGN